MIERLIQGHGLDHRWTPISQMSPALPRAAIAAEDSRFCEHHGFDFAAIGKAMKHDERRPSKVRGGSTISQQTAKNVFLWPDRSWVRKGAEAYVTVLIEALWGKPADHGGLSQHGGDGAGHLWRGGGGAALLPRQRAGR